MNLHPISAKVRPLFARAISTCLGSHSVRFQRRAAGAPAFGRKQNFRRSAAGATLVETAFAAAIVAVTSTGLYALYSHSLKIVGAGDQAATAQAHTLIRMEQLKNTGWAKLVNPTEIAALLSTPAPSSLATLSGFKQVISVYPMTVPATSPAPSPAPAATPAAGANPTPYFTVTLSGSATPVASPAGFSPSTISSQNQLNFRVLTEWQCWGKTHQRELSTSIAHSSFR